jgi:indolepyruvate decarboxylase
MASTTIAKHIARRLQELGAKHLFCVPGNYNAEFLLSTANDGIQCVGTTNELEAGYAADASARLGTLGVCCATFGVGSFSLYNAIAGSYVEYCPVVVLNGSANADKARQLVDQGVLFAHAIDTIRTDEAIFRPITCATTVITGTQDAVSEIDRVLLACVREKRPVYLEVRQKVWVMEVESPAGALRPEEKGTEYTDDERIAADAAVSDVLGRVGKAQRPVLWGGEMLQRLGLQTDFETLVRTANLPYTTTLMSKGMISETDPQNAKRFIGVYDSAFAPAAVSEEMLKSDCLIALGTILCDFYGKIVGNSYDNMILAAGNSVRVGDHRYPNVPLDLFVHGLLQRWPKGATGNATDDFSMLSDRTTARAQASLTDDASAITWDSFFNRMKTFVQPDMLLLTDTSLALFPSAEIPIQRPGHFLAQTAWLSIGYTVGAALGAALTVPEARPVVFAGDGGFQMIPQAFSTLVRQKKPVIMFVFDNKLYGIEQYLVDQQILPEKERFYGGTEPASFFDVLPNWDYEKLAQAFGGVGYRVTTGKELENALALALQETNRPTLIAVHLDPHNLPAEIQATIATPAPAGLVAGERSALSALHHKRVALQAFD